MHMHQGLTLQLDVQQRVGLAGNLRQTAAQEQHQIGILDVLHHLVVAAQADVTDETWVIRGKQHLPAKRDGDRQVQAFGHLRELCDRRGTPAGAAQNGDRRTRLRQAAKQLVDMLGDGQRSISA